MKRHIIKGALSALMTVILAGSCSINVPSPDLYSDPDAITSVGPARSLLTSCYTLYPHYEYELSLLGNDLCPTNVSNKDISQQNIYNWTDKDLTSLSFEIWLAYYNCIANTDVLLDRMPNVKVETAADSTERDAVWAEARTLKAMCYFDLLRLYSSAYDNTKDTAGVVIKNVTGVETVARTGKKQTAGFIKGLLEQAVAVDNNPDRNGWLSQKAARYLLAELALYEGNYAEAAKDAEILVDACSDSYISASNYSNLWSSSSWAGRIFGFYTTSTIFSSIEYNSTDGDYFAINPKFTYRSTDVRGSWTIYDKEIKGTVRHLMGKYNKANKDGSTISYINRMRWAGAFFIAAESEARLGNESKARTILNRYLKAVGSDTIEDNVTGQALVERILQEKYKEFVGEGQNFFDLKRTGSSLKRLGTWGTPRTTINPDDYRWTLPIPASEYKYNESITQNEGWPINR